jgi:hypothetical protein
MLRGMLWDQQVLLQVKNVPHWGNGGCQICVWPGGQVWSRCGDRDREIRTTRFRPKPCRLHAFGPKPAQNLVVCPKENDSPGPPPDLPGEGRQEKHEKQPYIQLGLQFKNILDRTSGRILDFSFGGRTEAVTKRRCSWFPGLISGAFYSIFRAWPV